VDVFQILAIAIVVTFIFYHKQMLHLNYISGRKISAVCTVNIIVSLYLLVKTLGKSVYIWVGNTYNPDDAYKKNGKS
jgi:hypothetical protein